MSVDSIKYDILKELFNVSIGKAASLLSEITGQKIVLRVPDIIIINIKRDKEKLIELLPTVMRGTLMVSSITFKDRLTGVANLVFPADKARELIDMCLDNTGYNEGSEPVADLDGTEFTDIDFDIIREIGNIILNSIIGEISNDLDMHINYSLPSVKVLNNLDYRYNIANDKFSYMLILNVSFTINGAAIEGAIRIDMSLKSLGFLLRKAKQYGDMII